MGNDLIRGPGILQWEHDHQATPLSNETYLGPDFDLSVTMERIADSNGQPEIVSVIYQKSTNRLGLYLLQGASEDAAPFVPTLPVNLILSAIPLAVTQRRAAIVTAWIAAEGGLPWNNPLNVAAPLNRSWSYTGELPTFRNDLGNGFGVAEFDTLQNGCIANARVLNQDNMRPILNAIINEDYNAFQQALVPDHWGTDPNAESIKELVANA